MLLILIMILDGLRRFKTLLSWKNACFAATWAACFGWISGVLFAGGGTLQDPRGDGIVTAWIRQATGDGPLVAFVGLTIMGLYYGGIIFFWIRATKLSKA